MKRLTANIKNLHAVVLSAQQFNSANKSSKSNVTLLTSINPQLQALGVINAKSLFELLPNFVSDYIVDLLPQLFEVLRNLKQLVS